LEIIVATLFTAIILSFLYSYNINNKLVDSIEYNHQLMINNTALLSEIELMNNQLSLQKEKKEKEIIDARKDALKRSRNVMRGQATEHLAPLIQDSYNPKDFRFMANPIDYVIFDGLSDLIDKKRKNINKIILLDVKTGSSNLTTVQRRIRDALKEGKVEFQIYNPDKEELG